MSIFPSFINKLKQNLQILDSLPARRKINELIEIEKNLQESRLNYPVKLQKIDSHKLDTLQNEFKNLEITSLCIRIKRLVSPAFFLYPLPNELLLKIISYLSFESIHHLFKVSFFTNVIAKDAFCKKLFINDPSLAFSFFKELCKELKDLASSNCLPQRIIFFEKHFFKRKHKLFKILDHLSTLSSQEIFETISRIKKTDAIKNEYFAKYLIKLTDKNLIKISNALNNKTVLFQTISLNLINCFKLMVLHQANLSELNQFSQTPLAYACYKQRFEIAKFLLDKQTSANTLDIFQQTPLMFSCYNGDLQLTASLLKIDALKGLNLKNQIGSSALTTAIINGHKEIVQLLLNYQCEINTPNFQALTPLNIALKYRFFDLAKILIDNRVDVNTAHGNMTPLMHAVKDQDIEACQLLLKHGANASINWQDPKGTSALHLATLAPHLKIYNLLVEYGADQTLQNINGISPHMLFKRFSR